MNNTNPFDTKYELTADEIDQIFNPYSEGPEYLIASKHVDELSDKSKEVIQLFKTYAKVNQIIYDCEYYESLDSDNWCQLIKNLPMVESLFKTNQNHITKNVENLTLTQLCEKLVYDSKFRRNLNDVFIIKLVGHPKIASYPAHYGIKEMHNTTLVDSWESLVKLNDVSPEEADRRLIEMSIDPYRESVYPSSDKYQNYFTTGFKTDNKSVIK